MTFGERMRARRKALRLSQTALAQATGLHAGRISDYECDRRTMTVETAVKIARALGVGVDYLAGTFDQPEAAAAPEAAAPAPPRRATRTS